MNNVKTIDCELCGVTVFLFDFGNHVEIEYEDFEGTKPHTKLDCKINAIITSRLKEVVKN